METILGKSWRTSLVGFMAGLPMLAGEIQLWFDADLESFPDWNVVMAAVGLMIGLRLTRDNGVNSRNAGAE